MTEPSLAERELTFLRILGRGQIVTGTVTEIASFGATFVDIGGFTAMINIPELSWRRFGHPCIRLRNVDSRSRVHQLPGVMRLIAADFGTS